MRAWTLVGCGRILDLIARVPAKVFLQYKRIAPVFWVLTILVAIILTFIIYKVIK